jgi:multidrug efflux pump subunit AcrB
VAHVSDSFATQTNIVHVNAKRAVYLAILKHADASTLAVVDSTRSALPEIQAAAPAGLELKLDFDQSVFVRGAVQNVIREAIISSILVSALILVFLGSWRNTVIVSASIPLSIFAGIVCLFLSGQTVNLMTLGGWHWRSDYWSTTLPSLLRISTAIRHSANHSPSRSSMAAAR